MGNEYNDRMYHARGTDDRMCYMPGSGASELDRFLQAAPEAFRLQQKESLLPSVQAIQAERLRLEAEFKQLLSDSGMNEQEFNVVVGYIREQQVSGYKVNERDIEDRVRALHPPKQKFPGTIDPRGYNIGLMPRTAIAAEFFYTAFRECVKAENIIECFGEAFSLFLDFVPFVGTAKGLIEAATGRDLITGKEIPAWARVLSAGLAAIPGARGAWKLTRLGVNAAQKGAKAAAKALAPIALVVALANKTPVDTLQYFKAVAELNETALKVALNETKIAGRGALQITKAQSKAVQDLSRLLSPDDIADIASKKAAKPTNIGKPAPTDAGNKLPDSPDALPVGDAGRGKRSGRKPKSQPKSKPQPKKSPPQELTPAYKRLEKKIKNKKDLSEYAKAQPSGEYQMKITGVPYEYVGKLDGGGTVAMDGLQKSGVDPKKLDVVDAKWGGFNKQIKPKYGDELDANDLNALLSSGHVLGYHEKIDHLRRLATFALENSKEIGRVKILCNNDTVAYIYLMVKGALPDKLGKMIDIDVIK